MLLIYNQPSPRKTTNALNLYSTLPKHDNIAPDKFSIQINIFYLFCHQIMCYGYGKYPKISNTLFHTILAQILLYMQLFPKIPGGVL